MLVGMNPGPWGMSQTGIPFGAVNYVRDWMGIEEKLGDISNLKQHPKRPIQVVNPLAFAFLSKV
jgi:single-strand selective monofunctional uracil DNA glycosylase